MQKIDCLGDICPIPTMRLQAVAKQIEQGESYMIITDHSCALGGIVSFCRNRQLSYVSNEVINGVWEITVSAGKSPTKSTTDKSTDQKTSK